MPNPLDTVLADPDDTAARLAYADHLEDMGDPNHELVRLAAQVTADQFGDSPAWERLAQLVGGFDNLVARLDEQQRRLLACDVAERVLRAFGQHEDTEWQLRAKVETSRRYAVGGANEWEMQAAWSGAWVVARDADWGYAYGADAARASRAAGRAAWNAAWTAYSASWSAYSASFAAREDAERLAALPAEGRWQVCRAVDYMLGLRQ